MSKIQWFAIILSTIFVVPCRAMAGIPVFPLTSAVCLQSNSEKPAADKDKSATDPEALKKLIERINKLEAEVERLKNGQPGQAKVPPNGELLTLVDIAHVGMLAFDNSQTRFVALHILVANTTSNPVTIAQDQVTCEIDGETRKLETIPPAMANSSIMYMRQNYSLQTMQPEKTRTVPAGAQVSFWMVFPRLPMGASIPRCKLKLTLGETTKEIDVNAVQRAMLGLETERIGPRECLGLMTITGTMTMFNTQTLVDEIDKLVNQKVSRLVVRWSEDAKQPDGQILNWLQNSTSPMAQIRNANEIFPQVSAALREYHLVRFSENDANGNYGYRGNASPNRVHATAVEAVGAALRTAYQALPRDELLQEIRDGHPLTRAAALAYGGGRLDVEHLPMIFQWIEDKDPDVQRAALQTLSHFGEPEAIEKLVFYVKRNIEPLSGTAVESLAGSRFGAAHEALLQLLSNEPPAAKKRIVQVLARFPRPVWSETLYEFANDPRAGLNLDAVKALVQVGHPKLVDVLEAGLKGDDKALRELSFQTLAERTDERSEKLAIDYTLAHLKTSPPDAKMTQLLSRTRDAQAIPLLLEQLEKSTGDKNAILNLLIQIGDQSVAEKLVEKYPSLQPSEKAQVLNGLRQFRHPKFREFAGAALLTGDGTLVSTAANALMQEGHPEGEKLLITALEKQTTGHLLPSITSALANYGTTTARAALIKAKDSGDRNKANFARQALLQIRHRLPGFQYYVQGIQRLIAPVDMNDKQARLQQEKDSLEFFNMALDLEPQLAEAYAGRGKVYLRQNKMSEAGKDFEKALELNLDAAEETAGGLASISEVVTGLAAARVADGRLDDAVKLLESNREKFKKVNDGLYLYNVACVYSRAVEYLKEHKDVPDAAKKIEEFRKKSLADLEESIKQGFADFDWMAKDPDFNTLHEDDDFKKLLTTRPARKSEEEKKDPEEQ